MNTRAFVYFVYFHCKLQYILKIMNPCLVLTDSDIKFEKECRRARRDYLLQVRLYNEQTKEFFKTQRDAADALWKVSVKYNILLEYVYVLFSNNCLQSD